MHFLVIDGRFPVPVFVFLDLDPRGTGGDPALVAREVTLDLAAEADRGGVRSDAVIAADPGRRDRFREFPSDRAARAAGFSPVEPRYVGPTWNAYQTVFRPEGTGPAKRPAARPPAVRAAVG